jgi:ComF family protein
VSHPLLEGFFRLLAPVFCPGCDLLLRPGEAEFCEACLPLLEKTPSALQPPAASAALYVYGGPLADAIRRLKYGSRSEFGPVLGRLLARGALTYAGRVDAVMPMPLHPRALQERGFNQSLYLARPVARALAVRLDTRSLERRRDTREQAGLSRAGRIANVKEAFQVRSRTEPGRVLLVDDVRTTGATLASAGEALLEAGASLVYTLALARAEP